MRDFIKNEDYFQRCIYDEKIRISKYIDLYETLDSSNKVGIKRGRLYLSHFYRNLMMLNYSAGESAESVIDAYIEYLKYYKDVCSPNDSMYDIIDILSIGVILNNKKNEFIDYLKEIIAKYNSQDGMIVFFTCYLEDIPYEKKPSQINYFNQLLKEENKEDVLSKELLTWYNEHENAYWYNSHKSKSDTYCGYWCFEVAALGKIFNINDENIRDSQYYPYDLVHYENN